MVETKSLDLVEEYVDQLGIAIKEGDKDIINFKVPFQSL